jgi:hypothetical protein
MFYKLNVGNSPEFLCDLIPPSVGETNNYNLRNSHNISQTTNRLSISQQSFFPSTPQEQDGLWIKLAWHRSLRNALQLFLILVCSIYQLWTFYEVNMLYMDLLGLYWPRTTTTKKYFVPFFINCKCTHWLKHLAVWKSNL